MSILEASASSNFRQVGRADLATLPLGSFQTWQIERFLGPIDGIRAEVARGAGHVLTLCEGEGQPLGFFVTHPDRHDSSAWWIGYLAVAPTASRRGLGRRMLTRAIRRLGQIPGCARIMLLVDPDNGSARRLHASFGFHVAGLRRQSGELILARAVGCLLALARRRATMRRPSLRRRTAAERSPARICAVWGSVLPGTSPP